MIYFSKKEIDTICDIAGKAGKIIMNYYDNYKDLSITDKSDGSPVTKADLAANNFIVTQLNKIFPNIAIVSEENSKLSNVNAAKQDKYFLIDPLDGTSSFIKKSDEFTVNIALIDNGRSVFGVIYLPVKDVLYFTDINNNAYKINDFSKNSNNLIKIKNTNNKDNLVVICTQREPEKSEIIDDLNKKNIKVKQLMSVSSSYKFCLIAEGIADLYPRRASIKSWDIAAGHAIVNASGGSVLDLNKNEILYNVIDNFTVPFFQVT